MSRYVQWDLKNIRSLEMLLAALAECGYSEGKVEVHETAQSLYGHVGDKRADTANVIIRRHNTGIGASNDIGFLKLPDGSYKAIVSEYDRGALKIKDMGFVEAVTQAYGRLNADKAVRTLIMRTIPGLKLQGKIPQHATIKRETVDQQTRVTVSF